MKITMMVLALVTNVAFAKNPKDADKNVYKMTVTEKGYEPSSLKVPANTPITLKITRKTNSTCAREITVPSQKLKVDLPMDKEVTVKLVAMQKGEIKFGCAMDLMIGGVMLAE